MMSFLWFGFALTSLFSLTEALHPGLISLKYENTLRYLQTAGVNTSSEDLLKGILYNLELYGEWYSTSNINQANYFTENSGFIFMGNEVGSPLDTDDTDVINSIEESEFVDNGLLDIPFTVCLFNGNSVGQNTINISISFDNLTFNETNSYTINSKRYLSYIEHLSGNRPSHIFSATNKISNLVQLYVSYRKLSPFIDCLANIGIYFINRKSNQPILFQSQVSLYGFAVQIEVESSDCSMSFITTVMTTSSVSYVLYIYLTYSKFLDGGIVIYMIVMGISWAIDFLTALQWFRVLFTMSPDDIKQISFWSICITNSWELFLAVLHVSLAINLARYWILVLTVFFFFANFLLSQISHIVLGVSRPLLAIWKRTLIILIPMLVLYLGYFFAFTYSYNWVLMISCLYLLPQIIKTYRKKQRPPLYYYYNFGFAFSKIAFMVYCFLFEDNIFGELQEPLIGYPFIGLIILQVLIIIIQKKYARIRFALRKIMMKTGHTKSEDLCPICLQSLRIQQNSSNPEGYRVVETPCQHLFHVKCLEEWLKVQFVCPLDRQRIGRSELLI